MQRYDQIIVGGGAMGRAAAWQLTLRGQRVLLLEQFAAGHTRGASHGATRNLNNAYAEPFYLDLFDEAFALWRELEASTGEQLLTLCGLVSHGDPTSIDRAYEALSARDARAELITPDEATTRWPGMRFEGKVLFNHDAGRIHAATALEVLAAETTRLGGEIRFEHRVTEISVIGDGVSGDGVSDVGASDVGVRVTAVGPDGESQQFEAAGAVVAAGAWSHELVRGIVDLTALLPSLRVTEEHPAHFAIRHELLEPGAETWWPSFNHFRGASDSCADHDTESENADPNDDFNDAVRSGSIYGMLTPGEGVKVGFHLVGDEVDPDHRRFRASDLQRAALRDYVAQWIPGLDPDSAEEISCTYTSTASERFVLDRVGPITVAAGFSGHGFKFTPAIGRILADAALGTAFPPEPFRLASH